MRVKPQFSGGERVAKGPVAPGTKGERVARGDRTARVGRQATRDLEPEVARHAIDRRSRTRPQCMRRTATSTPKAASDRMAPAATEVSRLPAPNSL